VTAPRAGFYAAVSRYHRFMRRDHIAHGIRTTFLGALLCGAFWYFTWSDVPILSRYAFFPLWLGYIVFINGISELVFADSFFRRAGANFLWLFAASVPFWWFFEYLNTVVQNWYYEFAAPISPLHFAIESSVDFSTVVPAVLSTTFVFYRSLKAAGVRIGAKKSSIDSASMRWIFAAGILGLVLLWLAPRQAFPLVWIAPFLLIEPLLYFASYPSLLEHFSAGRRVLLASVMAATLFTGFWWECWNFYSMPKWAYTVPYVGFWKIFEMPALGYLGYPFFGLIVFSYSVLAIFLFFGERSRLGTAVAQAFDLESSRRQFS